MNDGGSKDPSGDAAQAASDDADDVAAADGGDADAMACGSGDDIRTGAPCDENVGGIFAMKTVLDVWWQDDIDPPIVDSGRGYITLFQKATIADACDDGMIESVVLQTCGLSLPPLISWLHCNAYQMAVPDSAWDEPTMPTWTTTGAVSDFDLDGALTLGNINALIGIELVDDEGMWPPVVDDVLCGAGSNQPEACFPDHDGDGLPGVPLSLINIGENYRATGCGLGEQPVQFDGFRTDALLVDCEPDCPRAIELHSGTRASLAARAELSSCTDDGVQLVGDSSATAIDMRMIGCERKDGAPCFRDEVLFVDSMLPRYTALAKGTAPPTSVYVSPCDCPGGCAGEACVLDQTPSVGARTAMIRLGDTMSSFDCEDVRSAVEAAYPGVALQ